MNSARWQLLDVDNGWHGANCARRWAVPEPCNCGLLELIAGVERDAMQRGEAEAARAAVQAPTAGEPTRVCPDCGRLLRDPGLPTGRAGDHLTHGHRPGARVTSRVQIVFQKLPDRRTMTMQERHMLLDSDIREAMALAARRLDVQASQYRQFGYDWNLDDITYDIAHVGDDGQPTEREVVPSIIAALKIERPD